MLNSITSPLDGIPSPFGAIRNPFAAYAIGGQTPQTIADFEADKYRANGTTSTAASLLTHTRAGTATYTDNTGTLQTAASGELRKDNHIWNGSSWVKRCLVEPQSTNLITYSSEFDNGAWSKFISSVTPNTSTAPDGTLTADTLSDDNAGGTGELYVGRSLTVATSTTYTYSMFCKADQLNFVAIRAFGFTSPPDETSYFNLSTGSVTSSGANLTTSIQNAGNGWYRCVITFTTDATDTSGFIFIYPSENGTNRVVNRDGTSSILIYGAQLEASPVPTSYIPTAGATVTRPADALSIDSTLLPYDSTAMTIAMEGEMTYADTDSLNEVQFAYWEDDSLNLIYVRLRGDLGTGGLQFGQADAGTFDSVTQTSSYSPGINVPFNIASRHTSSDLNGAVDGTALTANTTPTALPDLSATDFQIAPTGVINIKSLRILGGYGATDAELEAATT